MEGVEQRLNDFSTKLLHSWEGEGRGGGGANKNEEAGRNWLVLVAWTEAKRRWREMDGGYVR